MFHFLESKLFPFPATLSISLGFVSLEISSLVFGVTAVNRGANLLTIIDVLACDCQRYSQGYPAILFISRDSSSLFSQAKLFVWPLHDHNGTKSRQTRTAVHKHNYGHLHFNLIFSHDLTHIFGMIFFFKYLNVPLCTASCWWLLDHSNHIKACNGKKKKNGDAAIIRVYMALKAIFTD